VKAAARVEAPRLAVGQRLHAALAQVQEPGGASGDARGGRGLGEAEVEMEAVAYSRPPSRPHVRAVGQRNGESDDKRSPDRETKRAILDHDSQWSPVERHWREGLP